jgi:hypothetical protein
LIADPSTGGGGCCAGGGHEAYLHEIVRQVPVALVLGDLAVPEPTDRGAADLELLTRGREPLVGAVV